MSVEDLYFFDPLDLFVHILSSDLSKNIHLGMAEYHDNPIELWHSRAWNSLIRSTSGEFAHYSDRKPIFPSDFVLFIYTNPACQVCTSGLAAFPHTGRVLGVGKDMRSSSVKQQTIVVKIQEVYLPHEARDLPAVGELEISLEYNEALLS